MNSMRKNATITGVLFILATLFGVIAAAIYNPILSSADYLASFYDHRAQAIMGIFLIFGMAMCCAGVGVSLYPVLRRFNEEAAIGSAGFRIIESMIQVVGTLIMVCLLALSSEYIQADNASKLILQSAGSVLRAGNDWLNNSAMLLSWGVAAVIYYSAFYKYKLVPRWISVWGLIGISLTIITSIMMMFNPGFSTIQTIANMPIALQEMVLAVWLIVKGFSLPENI
ncbi:MAG TPA: DUF4386 domain-containing protein [Anaerolineaceae bacterium]|nr:DUF4386 domain-containing protein [Anaerolineaceae bacterium]